MRVGGGRFCGGIEARHVGDELGRKRWEMHVVVRAAYVRFAVHTGCARAVQEKVDSAHGQRGDRIEMWNGRIGVGESVSRIAGYVF